MLLCDGNQQGNAAMFANLSSTRKYVHTWNKLETTQHEAVLLSCAVPWCE